MSRPIFRQQTVVRSGGPACTGKNEQSDSRIGFAVGEGEPSVSLRIWRGLGLGAVRLRLPRIEQSLFNKARKLNQRLVPQKFGNLDRNAKLLPDRRNELDHQQRIPGNASKIQNRLLWWQTQFACDLARQVFL